VSPGYKSLKYTSTRFY